MHWKLRLLFKKKSQSLLDFPCGMEYFFSIVTPLASFFFTPTQVKLPAQDMWNPYFELCNRCPMQRQQKQIKQVETHNQSVSRPVMFHSLRHYGCSLPGSSVYGDSPDKNTGVGSIFYSRGSSRRDWTGVSCIAGRLFTIWATREAHNTEVGCISFSRGSSWSRGQTHISWFSCNEGKFFTSEPPRKPSQSWVNKS